MTAGLVGIAIAGGMAVYFATRDAPLGALEARDVHTQSHAAARSRASYATAKLAVPTGGLPHVARQSVANPAHAASVRVAVGGHDNPAKPAEPHSPTTDTLNGIAIPFVPVVAQPASISKVPASSPEIEAQQLFDDAQAAQRAGNAAVALDLYRQALARNPAMLQARLALATLLRDGGRSDEAVSLLEAGYALRAQPALAVMVGRLLADFGRREEALVWLARARDSLRPADQALMGALYAQLQRHDEAVQAYQRALGADPAQGGWLLGLGLSLEALGRRDEARAVYRNALERGTFKPEVEKFLRDRSGASNS